jgi:hypothetical protein
LHLGTLAAMRRARRLETQCCRCVDAWVCVDRVVASVWWWWSWWWWWFVGCVRSGGRVALVMCVILCACQNQVCDCVRVCCQVAGNVEYKVDTRGQAHHRGCKGVGGWGFWRELFCTSAADTADCVYV